jgi:8-oxo-dGTP pyrophosphatase MutT (NUDIX family)
LTRVVGFATSVAMSLAVVPIDDLDLTVAPWSWPFAHERRAEIDAHFAQHRLSRPRMWNGRVMLTRDYRLAGRSLAGTCFETDFASFLAWRDWGFPDPGVANCFAMGALRSSDGAFLLGVMGPHTANAGLVYFPAGTPDPGDVVGGRLDLAGSLVREIAEETGLVAGDYAAQAGWHAVPAGPRLALIRILAVRASALELQRKIRDHIARDAEPELADVRIVRGHGDFDPMMPPFVIAYLEHCFR